MRKNPLILALILATAAVPLLGASVPPLAPPLQRSMVIQVHGCHSDIRTGYVRELGRSARHQHRGPDCEPFVVETRSNAPRRYADCHRDVRTHRVDGMMLRHRHVGNNCAIREARRNSSPTGN